MRSVSAKTNRALPGELFHPEQIRVQLQNMAHSEFDESAMKSILSCHPERAKQAEGSVER